MFLKLILDILLSQRVENKAVRTVYYIMFKECYHWSVSKHFLSLTDFACL